MLTDFRNAQWSMLQAQLGEHPALIRKNQSIEDVDYVLFPHQLIASIQIDTTGAERLPEGSEEQEALDETEDCLTELMCDEFGAALALVVTTDGVRDLFFYCSEEPETDSFAKLPLRRDVELHWEENEGWVFYRDLP